MLLAICDNWARCLDAIPRGLWSEGSSLALTMLGILFVTLVQEALGYDE